MDTIGVLVFLIDVFLQLGRSALMMATHKGLQHIVHLLLARNAEVNLQTHVSLSAKGAILRGTIIVLLCRICMLF